MRNSLRIRLSVIIIALALGPLIVVGSILIQRSFVVEREQAIDLQNQVAQRVSAEMDSFMQERENELLLLGSEFRRAEGLDRAQQISLILGTFNSGSYQNIYEEFALLDDQGQEQFRLDRLEIVSHEELQNRASSTEFQQAVEARSPYFGTVQFDEAEGEPFMIIAIPLFEPRSVAVSGVLTARLDFDTIGRQIAQLQTGAGQTRYIIDASGQVVAHQDRAVDVQNKRFVVPQQGESATGLDGGEVILAVDEITIGSQLFIAIAEKPELEALTVAHSTGWTIALIIGATLVLAALISFLTVKQIVRPIDALVQSTQTISAGDFSQRVQIARRDELGALATSFNSMAGQLQDVFSTLEERIQERTQEISLVAAMGERLTAILNLEELLKEIVNQIQTNFGYYHVHIYQLSEDGETLIMTEGTGQAGETMKMQGHSILLSAETSLVARAARTKETVLAGDVQQTVGWLSNPLLPKTQAEMAVPIILEGQIVGVLDVQSDEVEGLDENDVILLRSMASQVAVAIRNARQFSTVEDALANAEAIQARYLEDAWGRLNNTQGQMESQFQQPGAPSVDAPIIRKLNQKANQCAHPIITTLEDDDLGQPGEDQSGQAVLAPIRLLNQTIGTIQLHQPQQPRQWADQEIALIQTVADQVAQTAENLRLFDETRKRTDYEQTIRQITDKLRAAPNLEQLISIATQELGQHLSATHAKMDFGISNLDSQYNGNDVGYNSMANGGEHDNTN